MSDDRVEDIRPMTDAIPIRFGMLHDFPQADGGSALEDALRLGIGEVAASGRLDREVAFVHRTSRGLPAGSEHEIVQDFEALRDEGVLAIVGPAISDNALIVAPLCDAARLPAINYSGGERTRSEWMFHYQVGSLEEEPPVLAQRMVERGLARGGRVRSVARRPSVRRVFRSGACPARARSHRHRIDLPAGRERRGAA